MEESIFEDSRQRKMLAILHLKKTNSLNGVLIPVCGIWLWKLCFLVLNFALRKIKQILQEA